MALQEVYGPIHQVHITLVSYDGQNLISCNKSICALWSEHFLILFSANRNVQDTAIHRIPKLPLRQELDEPPAFQETIEAIVRLQFRKVARVDDIAPEI